MSLSSCNLLGSFAAHCGLMTLCGSMCFVSIASDNGLWIMREIWTQALANAGNAQLNTKEHIPMAFYLKFKYNHLRRYIWNVICKMCSILFRPLCLSFGLLIRPIVLFAQIYGNIILLVTQNFSKVITIKFYTGAIIVCAKKLLLYFGQEFNNDPMFSLDFLAYNCKLIKNF